MLKLGTIALLVEEVACKDYKEDNVIIAGNPGKIIKRNITWDRRNPYHLNLARDKEEK